VSDELKGKVSDKQGETCDIIETKLILQAKSQLSLAGHYWPLFIGGQVGFDTDSSPMAVLHINFLIQIQNTSAPILGRNYHGSYP
jgi:hypothetical protein